MDNDWIVQIVESPGRFDLELWIYRRAPNNGTEVWYGDITEIFPNSLDIKKPSMILSPSMLKGLQQVLSNMGIKPDHETFALGKLEATEDHLTDLRYLLKLPAQQIINEKKK